ncbi:MAG: GNAT family protein [Candidatus Bipolaricaulota bacterium]|nr:GNAT family protein [Candidatus Bipolaricaulota bacterium]
MNDVPQISPGSTAARPREPQVPATADPAVQFETPRLVVRAAVAEDALFIEALWSDPRVTCHVGFPLGIPSARDDVPRRIRRGDGLTALLIAEERESREPIGQCMLGALDSCGTCEPDIKLAPPFWGLGYGRELWAALVDQLFLESSCTIVRGTPNIANMASIRMQESAGMRRVGRGVSEFPASMQAFTAPVPHFVYEITREEWKRRMHGQHPSSLQGL